MVKATTHLSFMELQTDPWAFRIWKYPGFKHYYGKTEYNNDADFDGVWGSGMSRFSVYEQDAYSEKGPFMSTVFSVTSHEPFRAG